MEQRIGYCTAPDGVRIAYATYGASTAPPLIHVCDLPLQEAIWSSPWGRAFYEALAAVRRLVTLDLRGFGASQRDVADLSVGAHAGDVLAVADHLGFDRFELFGGGARSETITLAAATRAPERVAKLVLFGPTADSAVWPPGQGPSARHAWRFYTRALATFVFPTGPADAQRWFARTFKELADPETAARNVDAVIDLTPLLPRLGMPALILHRRDAQNALKSEVRRIASLLPNARLVTLDGDVGAPYWDHEQFIDAVYDFLGVEPPRGRPDEAPVGLSVVLFADIAASTALTERLGDAAFRERSRALDASLRTTIRTTGGAPVEGKVLGDGVLGVFPSARDALGCALACTTAARDVGLEVHVGLHAGDVIREGDGVYGGAVNLAARVCEAARPGEVLVSEVVRQLARTSADVAFEERGPHELKGVAEPQRLYAVRRRGVDRS